MNIGDIIGTIAFVGLVGSIPLGIYLEVKKGKKEWEEQEKADKEWLEAEMNKPRAFIQFVTLDDVTRKTAPCDPYHTCPGSKWAMKSNSESLAHRRLASSYESGYFMDSEQNSYPACNIKTAKVVVDEK